MNDIYSFYQLISKYQIEIPIIQRDYAQGRNNPKAKDIRKSMVSKIIETLQNEDKTLFFDFVYGRIDGNTFIPFDGQQRLTTLFLFHKYIFEKCQSGSECQFKEKCICMDILKRFTYTTRQSSREFCEKLVEENIIPKDGENRPLSEYVINQSWFYSDWEKDPTIMGMLTMLDEIHKQIQERGIHNSKPLAEQLTSGCSCPITFHFMDMGKHKLSDDTYVKMNARGKTLTAFENFKASLEQYLEEKKEKELLERLKGKYDENDKLYTGIDGKWLDLFWNVFNKEKEQKDLPDSMIMSFINRHLINVWNCEYKNKENEEKDNPKKELVDLIKEMPLFPTKDQFVSWEIYQFILDNCEVEKCLEPIFNIWDYLCNNNNNEEYKKNYQAVWNRDKQDVWNLFEGIKNSENSETYPSRVAFFALLKFFEKEKQNIEEVKMAKWMRVVWNIIENSTIDSLETYQAALHLIKELSEHSHEIYKFLAKEDTSITSGHANDQVKEEIEKAKQIRDGETRQDGKSWEEIIIDAEKSAFFKGAIRFLFTDGNGNICWDDFDKKWEYALMYFNDNGVKEDYKKDSKLLKNIIKYFDKWEDFWRFNYDNEATTWKQLLTSGRYKAIHSILLENSQIDNNINLDGLKNQVRNVLLNTSILVKSAEIKAKLNWRDPNYCLYPYNTKSQRNIFIIGNNRNSILISLCNEGIIKIEDRIITVNEDHEELSQEQNQFLWGWEINFKLVEEGVLEHNFQWHRNNNVYLMGEKDPKKYMIRDVSKSEELEKYICFKASDINDKEIFVEKLKELIEEWNNNKTKEE